MEYYGEISRFENALSSSRKVAVLSHYSPDGDAVGSVIACCEYLESRGLEPFPILPSPIPLNLRFLTESREVAIYEENPGAAEDALASADMIICLDVSNLRRTEYMDGAAASSSAVKVLIDHHVRVEGDRFDIVFSTVSVSSACELLYDILMKMPGISGDASGLTPLCRDALYTGMMTDTNNFSNSVYPGTFTMGAELLRCGVHKDMLQEKVFKSFSAHRMRLMGHLLFNRMQIVEKYNAAYMILSQAEKDEYNFVTGDSEGFVNLPLSIADVRISALFTQTTTGYIRVSLRSKIGTDVNVLANRWYNGGGHVNAAGGRLFIGLDEIGPYFVKSLEDYFGR